MLRRFALFILCALLGSLPLSAQETQAGEERVRERQQWLRDFMIGDQPPTPAGIRDAHQRLQDHRRGRRERLQSAAEAPQAAVGEPVWVSLGPSPSTGGHTSGGTYDHASGRISAIAVDPRNKNVVYAGAASGGVWKSTDGGAFWVPLTDDQPSLATSSIAIDPMNPDTIYVGTGEIRGGSGAYYGAGILKSTDGGQNWTVIGQSLSGPQTFGGVSAINSLSISPDGSRMLAGVKHDTPGDTRNGIFLSTDGGLTWSNRTPSMWENPHVVVFANNSIAYAGVSTRGIMKSIDGGQTWADVSTNKIPLGSARVVLDVSRQDPNVVYAALESANGPSSTLLGLFKTTDGGATWTNLNVSDFCGPQCWWDMAIAVSPTDHNVVWAAGYAAAYNVMRTTNGGQSWDNLHSGAFHVDEQALAFSADGSRVYLGNDGGMYRTDSVTSSPVAWHNLNSNIQTIQHYASFDIHPTDPNVMLVGSQDNGTHYAIGPNQWIHATCGDGAGAVFSQTQPTTSYLGCQLGEFSRSVTNQPGSWFNPPSRPGGSDPAAFIPAWVGDPTDGRTVYYGTHRLWQTRDGGDTWHAITEGINGNPDQGIVMRMGVCRANPDIVYLGASGGGVKKITTAKSSEVGTLLPFVETHNVLGTRAISSISVHPDDCNEAAITQTGFSGSRVWHTTNGGATWNDITGDLPGVAAYAIVLDPDVDGTLYLSTSLTVYVSRNGGQNWTPFGIGLPNAHGLDMKLHRPTRQLRLITHGRSSWGAHVPIAVPGPALSIAPGVVRFPDHPVRTSPRQRRQTLHLTNIGQQPLTLNDISVSREFALDRTQCGSQLAPGASCPVQIAFTPLDQGFITGTLDVASNATNGVSRAHLEGMAGYPLDNDSPDTARVIPGLPYRDKINVRFATGGFNDPATGCPAVSGVRSVWYRYTATQTGPLKVSTVGSDYHTNVGVFTGSGSPWTRVTCGAHTFTFEAPRNEFTFNAEAGVTYSFLISAVHVNRAGRNLVFSLAWPAALDVRPARVNMTALRGSAASQRVELRNESTTQPLALGALSITGAFTLAQECPSSLPGGATCAVVVTPNTTTNGLVEGEFSFTAAGESAPVRVPLRATIYEITSTGITRQRRSATTAATTSSAERTIEIATAPAIAGPLDLLCETDGPLQCNLQNDSVTPDARGVLTVRVNLAASRSRPQRLSRASAARFTLRTTDGTVLYTESISLP